MKSSSNINYIFRRTLSFLCLALVLMVFGCLFVACDKANGAGSPHEQNEQLEEPLKNFNMLFNNETAAKNFGDLGIFAPQEWTQKEYKTDSEGFDLIDYYDKYLEHRDPWPTSHFTLQQPILRLRGPNQEFVYGYADLASKNMPIATSLEDYTDLFIEANAFDKVINRRAMSSDAWLPDEYNGERVLRGVSFEVETETVKERIIILKMKGQMPTGAGGIYQFEETVFGVFYIGCPTEDYASKSSLFDRMERTIYGYGITQSDRFFSGTDEDVKRYLDTLNYNPRALSSIPRKRSVLGLEFSLPPIFESFTFSGNYANSFATLWVHWGTAEKPHSISEEAGQAKCEIYRDPVRFSAVFEPITDLYTLHADHVHDYFPEPPRLTKIGGVPAVYSVHNSFKDITTQIMKYSQGESRYLVAKEATRNIVYTFIYNDWIYTVKFSMTHDKEYNEGRIGAFRKNLSSVFFELDRYEQYYVFSAMDNLTFAA